MTGTTEANGVWYVTYVDANNFLLNGSTFVHAYTGGGTSTGGYTQLCITDNLLVADIYVSGVAPAAIVTGNSISAGGINVVGNGVTVADNVLTNSNGGIQITGTDAMVRGNSIQTSTTYGIVAGEYAMISGNKMLDCNTSKAAPGCILPQGNNCQIFHNHCENRTTAGKAAYAVYANSTTGHLIRDNRFVNMVTGDVYTNAPSPPVVPRSQETYVEVTSSSSSAAGETILKSTTLDTGSMGNTGGVHILCGGTSSTGTLKVYFGSSGVFADIPLTANTWFVDAYVFNAGGEASQYYEFRYYANGAFVEEENGQAFLNNTASGPTIIKVTGATSGTINCHQLIVERFE